jgi:hypothetical protein
VVEAERAGAGAAQGVSGAVLWSWRYRFCMVPARGRGQDEESQVMVV